MSETGNDPGPETPDVALAREKTAEAAKAPSQSQDPMIAALLRERAGYAKYGRTDRVKAVDEELKRRGHKAKAEPQGRAPRQAKQSTATAPAKKTAARKTTAKKTAPAKTDKA